MAVSNRAALALACVLSLGYGVGGSTDLAVAADDDPVVAVQGDVERPVRLKASDLAKMPRQSVKAKDHDGKESVFEGIPVALALEKAGVKLGQSLRGEAHAAYLLVEAADGYRVVFALPEVDESFSDRVILLADRQDGKPLNAHKGPFQIIVPGEKKHGRWVRQVTALTVRRVKSEAPIPKTATHP